MSVQIANGPVDLNEDTQNEASSLTTAGSQTQLLNTRPRTGDQSFDALMDDYDDEDFEESLLDKEKRRLEEESLKAARGVGKKPAIPLEEQCEKLIFLGGFKKENAYQIFKRAETIRVQFSESITKIGDDIQKQMEHHLSKFHKAWETTEQGKIHWVIALRP
jgi:hypothetical protein